MVTKSIANTSIAEGTFSHHRDYFIFQSVLCPSVANDAERSCGRQPTHRVACCTPTTLSLRFTLVSVGFVFWCEREARRHRSQEHLGKLDPICGIVGRHESLKIVAAAECGRPILDTRLYTRGRVLGSSVSGRFVECQCVNAQRQRAETVRGGVAQRPCAERCAEALRGGGERKHCAEAVRGGGEQRRCAEAVRGGVARRRWVAHRQALKEADGHIAVEKGEPL